jgi:hypothetical protein
MSTTAAPEQWFYSHQGQQRGPVSLDALRAMLAAGEVMWSEMVWSAGMATWSPASQVAALRPLSASPADLPPPLPPQPMNYAGPLPPPAHYRDPGDDPKMRMLLPVGRSPWAIAAGYLGLLSPLMIFAPFALIVSMIAMRDIKRKNSHGMGRAVFGLIMGGLCTIGFGLMVFAIIADAR